MTCSISIKTILLSGLLLAATHIARAQEANDVTLGPYKTMIGFRAGYSQHHLSGSEVDFRTTPTASLPGDKSLIAEGFTAGLIVRGQLYRRLALQGEMLYVLKGGQLVGPAFVNNDSYIVHYLQLPIVLNLALAKLNHLSLYIEGGYAANLAMSGPEIKKQDYAAGTEFEDRGVIFAPVVGGEIAWNQPKRSYFLHFRYSQDPSSFYDRTYNDKQYTLKNSGFSITTGVLFGVH